MSEEESESLVWEESNFFIQVQTGCISECKLLGLGLAKRLLGGVAQVALSFSALLMQHILS